MVPHNDFQNKINSYLQGSPDDTFTWFAGYRMQYYAGKGLLAPIDDVWENHRRQLLRCAEESLHRTGRQDVLRPNYNYPWGFFYRKSLWAEKGYEVPETFDALKALATKMQADGIIPIGFADKDGWPAMGTFDYMNMRLNGYQFHVDLCAHKESWDQQKVSAVFDTWAALLPFQDPAALGQTWQDAAKALEAKKTGMYLLGSFVTQQFTDPAVLADIDFFAFPGDRHGRPGRRRGPHRRPPAVQEGRREQGGPRLHGVPRHRRGPGRLRRGGCVQHRHRQGHGHLQVQRRSTRSVPTPSRTRSTSASSSTATPCRPWPTT